MLTKYLCQLRLCVLIDSFWLNHELQLIAIKIVNPDCKTNLLNRFVKPYQKVSKGLMIRINNFELKMANFNWQFCL